jgi:hypothetical protein
METDLQAGISERRYRPAALFKAYAAEKASDEWYGEWGAALLYRPLAIHVSPLLLRLGVPTSAVTISGRYLDFVTGIYSALDFLHTRVAILRRLG